MEIIKDNAIETYNGGLDLKEINSSISVDNLGFALEAVSKNLYSNPIGSIIRELTSNAIDANVFNEAKKPVIVSLYEEDGNWYFKVKDEGKGMNKQEFEEIYMSWFNSDKRNNNLQIGGWGLGSKSPLSYANDYEVITISENISYSYLISKSDNVPIATLIETKPSSKKSGTTIIVKVNHNDLYKFSTEIEKQLSYFSFVYVLNEYIYYNNNFNIIDTEYYKVRNNNFLYSGQLHICLNEVNYPIKWDVLNISPIYIPVGIKFNIGELPVTLSREEIHYKDEETKQKVKDKIKIVEDRLLNKYKKQFITNDLFEYIKFFKEDKNYLIFDENTKIKVDFRTKIKPKLDVNNILYSFNIEDIGLILSYFYKYDILTNKKIISKSKNNLTGNDILNEIYNNGNLFIRHNEINHWSNIFYENGIILKSKKCLKTTFKNLLYSETNFFNKNHKKTLKLGSALKTYKFIKYFKKELENKYKKYDNVPLDFINKIKESQKLLEKERKGIITTYNINNNKSSLELNKLHYDYVFYINKEEDKEILISYEYLFEILPKYYKNKLKFIIVAKTTISTLKKFEQFKPINLIWKYKPLKVFFIKFKYQYFISVINKIDYKRFPKKYRKLSFQILKNKIQIEHSTFSVELDRYKINLFYIFEKEINNIKIENKYKQRLILFEEDLNKLLKIVPYILINQATDVDYNKKQQQFITNIINKQYKLNNYEENNI